MQGMVAGKRSRGKLRQRWEKDIRDIFGTMTAASRVAEDRNRFHKDIWAADILKRICSQNKKLCHSVKLVLNQKCILINFIFPVS